MNARNFATTTPWPALGGRNYNIQPPYNPIWARQTTSKPYFVRNSTNNQFTGRNTEQPSSPTTFNNDDDELRDFSEQLLNRDTNNAARYVKINLQSKTTSRSMQDEAPLP